MQIPFSLNQLTDIVKKAGQFALHEFNNFSKSSIEYKGRNDLVSYVDKETEKRLVADLTQLMPEAGFITEEDTVENQQDADMHWIIDPIDGTTNFVHGIPYFAVSVALAYKGTALAGVVDNPPLQECFYAERGKGAFCNGAPLQVSGVKTLDESLVVLGLPYGPDVLTAQNFEMVSFLIKESHGFRRLGAAALDLAYVAAGRYDAFFEKGLKPWDMAAGILLIEEAGGKFSDFEGNHEVIFGKSIVASSPGIYDQLFDKINAYYC